MSKMNVESHIRELPTPSDLSIAAVDWAIGHLQKGRYPFHILECASQNMGIAMPLAKEFNISVKMNIDYSPDEWSVMTAIVRGNTYHIYRVHSVGA